MMVQALIVFSGDVNLIFFFVVLVVTLLFVVFKHLISSPSKGLLPPGPMPWPIIGNVLQMGTKPHISMARFAQLHGPLISLKLGTQLVVVASSPAAAAEILKTHDRLLSARSIPQIASHAVSDITRLTLIWADCTDHWKLLRTLCRTNLFSTKALESTSTIRERNTNDMKEFLGTKQGQVVNIAQVVSTTLFNSITSVFFSEEYCYYGDVVTSKLKDIFVRSEKLVGTPNIADLYPFFARFDLQGLRKKSIDMLKQFHALWEDVIKERRAIPNSQPRDFLDVLIQHGFADDQIIYLAIELVSAAADTTTSAIEWTMAELVKNKKAMQKVGEELSTELGNKDSIKEIDLSRLPYLLACAMEALRLHPTVPLLLPRRALETCQVMGYTIPKDTRVFVNLWAMGRDPETWEDPLCFRPERFLGAKRLNFQGQHHEYLPFSSGRRMCPGQPMASKQIVLILAHLLHAFDWCLPNNEDPANLDMSDNILFSLHKEQPLCLVPTSKLY